MKSSASRTLVFLALIITSAIIIVSAVNSKYTEVAPKPIKPISIVSEEGLININTADVQTLTLLEGIGEARAQLIIDFRTENGAFVTKEDLMRIDGIGQTLFNKIKDDITV